MSGENRQIQSLGGKILNVEGRRKRLNRYYVERAERKRADHKTRMDTIWTRLESRLDWDLDGMIVQCLSVPVIDLTGPDIIDLTQ